MPQLTTELLTQIATNQYTQTELDLSRQTLIYTQTELGLISHETLDEVVINKLCYALARNKAIKSLKLCQCGITNQMAQVLANNQTLTSLDISGNAISIEIEKAVQTKIVQNKLREEKQTHKNVAADARKSPTVLTTTAVATAQATANANAVAIPDHKSSTDEKTQIQPAQTDKYSTTNFELDIKSYSMNLSSMRDWDVKEEKAIVIPGAFSSKDYDNYKRDRNSRRYIRLANGNYSYDHDSTPLIVLSNGYYIACLVYSFQKSLLESPSRKPLNIYTTHH